jgi:hypothetical protein
MRLTNNERRYLVDLVRGAHGPDFWAEKYRRELIAKLEGK